MLDMGFLPAIQRICAALPVERQTLLFSATIEASVKKLVATHVRNAVRIELGSTSKPAEQVTLQYFEVDQDRKIDLLLKMLREEQGSFLVFSRTRHGADKLAKKLSQASIKTATIHGDRSQNQRMQALKGFQDGYYRVLVATDVAARGIDVEGVSHVINFDPPHDRDAYVHRIGRTGRAGRSGIGITLVEGSEHHEMGALARDLGLAAGPGSRGRVARTPRPEPAASPAGRHSAPAERHPSPAARRQRRRARPAARG
jgi:ATP-dependent RNA helicase RhlE